MVLRPDIDPKSAAPRSGAPKGELEKYGIWVKAEPQDVVEEPEAASSAAFDFDIPGSEEQAQESFLSEDEEKMLNSYELEGEEGEGSESRPALAGFDDTTLPDIEDIPSLEEPVGLGIDGGDANQDFDTSTIDISLDDLEASHEAPGAPTSRGAAERLESVEVFGPSSAAESGPESEIQAEMDMEDVSADFLGPSTGTAPSEGLDDVTAEFLGAEDSSPQPATEMKSEFEPIDIDLQFDDTIPSAAGGEPEGGFEEVTEFDDFLSSDSGADANSPLEAQPPKAATPPRPSKPSHAPAASGPSSPHFDDLAAVEKELEADAYEPKATKPIPAASAASDLSTEILLKIADELSSIRGELVSLKTQLSDIVRESMPQAPLPPPTLEEKEESSASGGFFDEEEDETIALTGDELDNILNTADFTEEVAEAEAPVDELGIDSQIGFALGGGEPAGDVEVPESSESPILEEKLLPESGEYLVEPAAESPIEEVILADEENQAEAVEELLEVGSIGQIADEGVHPMTQAPEDTSYLEEEAQAAPSLGEIPLVEPDLSAFNLEAEELATEPLAEMEEELPLVEAAETETLPESLELSSAELAAENLEAAEAELEPIEIIPEMDESAYGEINLHEEQNAEAPVEEFEEFEELIPIEEGPEEVAAKPSRPVPIHPDEIPTSLDDSLFVEAKPKVAEKPQAAVPAQPKPEQKAVPGPARQAAVKATPAAGDPDRLKSEIKSVLSYLDKLLDSLPEEKIEEFAKSEYFDTYKRLFEELGLV